MTQRNTVDPDPAGPPPPDKLDSLLRQWHAVNAEQAAAGRDRLLERIRAQERARKPRPTADRAIAGSLTAFFHLIRSALVNRYSPAAALMVFIVIFAVLYFPSSQGPAMAQVMMVPEGGRLDAIDDEGNIIGPCPLKHTDVEVSISGFLTRVTVTQTYHNPYHDKIEAVYTFPLSHRAAVDRMTMTVGDRVVVGEVKERGLARRIYEAAKAQNYVASLLEQERPNIFTQSVANIEPGTEVVVQIAYVEVLQLTDGSYSFDFPMVVGPRYVPGAPMTSPSVVPAELTPREGVVLLGPAALGVGAAGDVGTLGSLQTGKLRALLMAAGPVKYPGDTWWGRGDATGGAGQATLWYRFEAAYTDGSKEFGELYIDGTGQLNGRWFYTDPQTIAEMGTGFSPDTNQVPDASRITPEPVKPGSRAGHDISLTVTIDSGGPGLVDITCELHEIKLTVTERRQDGTPRMVTLALAGKEEIPNRDFVLSWRQTAETIQEATFVHTSQSHGAYSEGVGGFFTLILQPPDRVRDADVPPRELIFVMDTSGSMRGFPIAKSKEVMTRAIDAMRPGDTFNVITFAGFTDILWDAPRPANEKNRAQAKAFVESRRGSGGTEMMQAIKKALEQHVAGQPGALAPEQLADLPADGRAVEVAVGYERIRVTRQSDLYEIRIREDLSVTLDLTDDLPTVLQPHGVTVRLSGRWQTVDGRRVLVADRAWLVGRQMPAPPMRIVLFLTDGYVGNDMAIIDAVRSNAHTTRVFSFGIGNSVNRYLIDGMARAGRGEAEFVLLESDGDEAVARFTRRVETPVLMDIQLAFSEGLEVTDIIPASGSIPDLFDVKPLVIHGRYTTPGTGTLTIRGRTGAGPYERSIELQLPADAPGHDVIATVWARARVDEVLAPHLQAVQQGNPPEAVRNEVIGLGESFGLMTQYTSFVAVEKSRMTIDGKPVLVAVPIEMPQGVSYEGVFGGELLRAQRQLVTLDALRVHLTQIHVTQTPEVFNNSFQMQQPRSTSETHRTGAVAGLSGKVSLGKRTSPG
ncbi:MAG: VWA domain-containing protein, partial [Planctomycetes bacterium]|nr:VWA domain-containing protein [Planctomycetota bacterium]